MKLASTALALASLAAVFGLSTATALAQQGGRPAAEEKTDESWYYGSTRPAETYSVAQQKAMARAAARTARLESSRWYGFHHSRPTATAMAFTSMYSPAWQMPGARPFAWYPGAPVVVIR